jgi:hypothetical protein
MARVVTDEATSADAVVAMRTTTTKARTIRC